MVILFYDVYNVYSYLSRSEIILVSAVEFAATMTAVVLVVIDTGITYADGSFHAPAFIEYPLVTIRDAGPIKITLITMMPQAEDVQIANVEIGIMSVQAKEMSVEPFAQPVTKFRLYHPMLDLLMIREFPGIIVAGYVEGPCLSENPRLAVVVAQYNAFVLTANRGI